MKKTFPVQLQLVNATNDNPVNLERIQNELIRQSLEQVRDASTSQKDAIRALELRVEQFFATFNRRTAQWSPAKAPSAHHNSRVLPKSLEAIARQLVFTDSEPLSSSPAASVAFAPLAEPFTESQLAERASEDTGMYIAEDQTLRGFVVPSPKSTTSPRPRTSVDLILPPLVAFCAAGKILQPFTCSYCPLKISAFFRGGPHSE